MGSKSVAELVTQLLIQLQDLKAHLTGKFTKNGMESDVKATFKLSILATIMDLKPGKCYRT